MRVVWTVTIIVMLGLNASATTGAVYPGGSPMSFSWSVAADTVTVIIRAGATPEVTGLYLTDHTLNTPRLVRCLVDGATRSSIPTQTASLYAGIQTTRWFIGNFQSEVRFQYYVAGYGNSHLHWVADHAGPVFGVAFDPRCCLSHRGNVDNDPADRTDLSDVVTLVAILTGAPLKVQCLNEANVNGDAGGQLDVSDLSSLIAALIDPATTLAACPTQ